MAVSYVDRQTLAVLAPTVREALGISVSSYGWLVSAFSFAYLVGAPLAGRLIDAGGARRGLVGAVLVWSVVAALHAVVPGLFVLFALRIALGLTESPSFPGAAQTVHRALPPADRARGFGVLFTGSSFGAMVAPLLATWVAAHVGWRAAFLVTAVVGLCWVPLWIAVAFAGRARAVLDHAAEPPAGAPAPRPEALAVVGHPAVLRAILVVFASAPVISFALNWGAEFLHTSHAVAQKDVGRYLWMPPVLFDAGAVLFGHLASVRARRVRDGSPPRAVFVVAAVLCATAAVVPWATGPWSAVFLCGLAMAGGGGLFAILTADMMNRIPPGSVSTAGGITAAAQSLAYIIANPLIGYAVKASGTYTAALVALGAWAVPGCVAWLLWPAPPPHAPEPAEPS